MWTRPFQIAVRNQSEAELSDCREQGAQALRRRKFFLDKQVWLVVQ